MFLDVCLRLNAVCWLTPVLYLQINLIACNGLSEILAMMKTAWGLTPADGFLSCVSESDCTTCSIIYTNQV